MQVPFAAEGRLTVNEAAIARAAVLDAAGIGSFVKQDVAADIASGRLIRLPEDWTPQRPGFSIDDPGRRNASAGFTAFLTLVREGSAKRCLPRDRGAGFARELQNPLRLRRNRALQQRRCTGWPCLAVVEAMRHAGADQPIDRTDRSVGAIRVARPCGPDRFGTPGRQAWPKSCRRSSRSSSIVSAACCFSGRACSSVGAADPCRLDASAAPRLRGRRRPGMRCRGRCPRVAPVDRARIVVVVACPPEVPSL